MATTSGDTTDRVTPYAVLGELTHRCPLRCPYCTNPLLLDRAGDTLGAVLRTRVGTRPLIVSPGHRTDLATALELVMACTTRYRLPETTRWADGLASNRGQRWLARLDALR